MSRDECRTAKLRWSNGGARLERCAQAASTPSRCTSRTACGCALPLAIDTDRRSRVLSVLAGWWGRGKVYDMAIQPAHWHYLLAELAASGRHIVVQCGQCPNRRLARPSDLDLAMDIGVSDAGALLRRCECGSREVLTGEAGALDAFIDRPLWVSSGHRACSYECPLWTKSRRVRALSLPVGHLGLLGKL